VAMDVDDVWRPQASSFASSPPTNVGSPSGIRAVAYSDRFIPSRTGSDLATYALELNENAAVAGHATEREVCSGTVYAALLRASDGGGGGRTRARRIARCCEALC